ncbi:MAG TPA: type II toxin-antitoxin system VapC family toxin [Pirellulales bacterium]|jgi:tRNA(fMet)-specific endonuclease VapC|nr:type II toxin-antitoxin system VapC family toxin [Pirellulales bacterium]
MPLLLDTVTCSAFLKARPEAGIHSRRIQHGGQLSISRLSCAELYALGYRANAKKLEQIDDLLSELTILEFDDLCAREYGRLYARLAQRGQSAGQVDLMIAATALVHCLVLVTHDKDFSLIANVITELGLDDWLT